MKSRRTYQTTLHDLRDIDPAKFAVPNVSRAFAPPEALLEVQEARIVSPTVEVQITSQATPL